VAIESARCRSGPPACPAIAAAWLPLPVTAIPSFSVPAIVVMLTVGGEGEVTNITVIIQGDITPYPEVSGGRPAADRRRACPGNVDHASLARAMAALSRDISLMHDAAPHADL
jgi:hypothetical protein